MLNCSSSSSSSGSSASYSEPSYSESSNDSASSSASSGASSSNGAVSTGKTKIANDVVVSVTGGQKFRSVMNKDHTSYQVYHCGISKATFAEIVDTKDFTVNVTKGDASYLSTTIGVSGIKINGTVALSTVPETDAE